MHAVRTPSRGSLDRFRGGGIGTGDAGGGAGRNAGEGASSAAQSPSVARLRPAGSQQQQSASTANGNALRSRKSNVPDIGTPIKMASSSPYRTPESQSKASLFLSRTPFGTPAKTGSSSTAPVSSSTLRPNSGLPAKPVTGLRAESWALAKSLVDDNAYLSFALQPRAHLSYASALTHGLHANWFKLSLTVLVSLHLALAVSCLRPSHPLQSFMTPLQPVPILLSLSAFALMASFLLLTSGQPFSLIDKKWEATREAGLQDERLAGSVLKAGSPANLVAHALRTRSLWRGMFLYSIAGVTLAAVHLAALIHQGSQGWTPYHSVPVRLSQGYRSTAVRPNERFWFMLVSNGTLSGTYALLRYLLSIRSAQGGKPAPYSMPRFDAQAIFERSSTRLARKLRSALPQAVVLGVSVPLALTQTYLLIRRPIFRLLLSFIGYHSSIRPLIIPSFKRPLLTTEFVFRSTVLGLSTILFLECASIAWDVYATQPVSSTAGAISKFSREPTRTLIRAMQSRSGAPTADEAHLSVVQRQYYAHFAFAEMATLVATDAERRKAIFRDIGNASTPSTTALATSDQSGRSAWASIAQECMAVLREQRSCIERKGREAPTSATSATGGNALQAGQRLKPVDAAHRVTLAGATEALKVSKPSLWDRLASKPAAAAATTPAKQASASSAMATAQAGVPNNEGLNSILHRIAATPLHPTAAPISQSSTGVLPTSPPSHPVTVLDLVVRLCALTITSIAGLLQLLPSDLQHVLRNSLVARKGFAVHTWLFTPSNDTLLMAGVVPSDEALATWAVQTLSALLSSSLDQDEYGTVALASNVKLGVDEVLDEFAGLLLALQSWTEQVLHVTAADSGLQQRAEVISHVETRISPLIATLRNSITLVTGAFQPTGLRLRPSTAAKVEQALQAAKVVR